jgi:hypothetical protein
VFFDDRKLVICALAQAVPSIYRDPCANAQVTKKMNAVVWSVSVLYVGYTGSEMVKCISCVILPHFGILSSTHFDTAMESYVRISFERILFFCSSNNFFLQFIQNLCSTEYSNLIVEVPAKPQNHGFLFQNKQSKERI